MSREKRELAPFACLCVYCVWIYTRDVINELSLIDDKGAAASCKFFFYREIGLW